MAGWEAGMSDWLLGTYSQGLQGMVSVVFEGDHYWEKTAIGDYLMVVDSEGGREGWLR